MPFRAVVVRATVLSLVAAMPAAPAASEVVLHLQPDSSRVEYHIEHSIAAVTDLAGTPSGELRATATDAGVALAGRVEVDLRALQTGISQRDQHIRSAEYLDVEHHPTARFVLEAVQPDSGDTTATRARGTLQLHGVERPLELPVTLQWSGAPGQSPLHVAGRFVLRLADHGIKRPKKLLFAAGKTVDVRLDLRFAP
jgi:polyisoprenoid-binding protein YceI